MVLIDLCCVICFKLDLGGLKFSGTFLLPCLLLVYLRFTIFPAVLCDDKSAADVTFSGFNRQSDPLQNGTKCLVVLVDDIKFEIDGVFLDVLNRLVGLELRVLCA